ncbi:helix-turn-helix transcriptional regulator [Cohnella soli]|uniref:LuxR C-terminal-related transcriptional regulator n=1 Tax=Cohnella soli TaxID=425005 RepID=A0ABW0HQP6_9BACL
MNVNDNRIDLVGRDEEIRIFREKLTSPDSSGCLFNVYGTGGVGKSSLLDVYRQLSEEAGAPFIMMDCRMLSDDPLDFCHQFLKLLGRSLFPEPGAPVHALMELCLQAIRETTEKSGKLVIALDTFEEAGELENWLRDHFFKRICHLHVILAIAGRVPLQGLWLVSPVWRGTIFRIRLSDLEYEPVCLYLARLGIRDEEKMRRIWLRTRGHPLTLALLTSTTLVKTLQETETGEMAETHDLLAFAVNIWLREAPAESLQEALEAAAVLRLFNQELLAYVLEKEVPTEQFNRLAALSFVQRGDRGWYVHDLLGTAIRDELRLRSPARFERLRNRCIAFYCHKIRASSRSRANAWENAEWVYYFGDQLLQSIFYHQQIEYGLEPLHSGNWTEAESYIENRRTNSKELRIPYPGYEQDEKVEYVISAKESLYGLRHLDLGELYELSPDIVKLVRDRSGEVRGLLAAVPIHEHTLRYLSDTPLSRSYFASLSEAEMNALRVPGDRKAGIFIKALDIDDFSDPVLLQLAGLLLIRHMFAADFSVASPPPHPFTNAVMLGLGLEIAMGAEHRDYDESRSAPIFVLDRRGDKLAAYLDRVLATLDIQVEADKQSLPNAQLLTAMEKRVAELVADGRSNQETAAALYVSEATVKKHLSHIYRKLGVRNRTVLAQQFLAVKDRK